MRYMGIDYGTKRVGIAFSDEDGTMAFPHDVLPNDKHLLLKLAAMIKDRGVATVVVGHSLRRDGTDNPVQADIATFTEMLTKQTGIPVVFEPEQYSTQEALRLQGRTKMTDASAAAIILNSYITRTKE